MGGLWTLPDIPLLPRFICVTPNTKQKYRVPGMSQDPWMRCVEFPKVAMIGRGSAYIFICPDFFKLPARDLLQPKKCPTVANNLFQPPQPRAGFFYSQAYYLLIPLIRVYLGQNALPADELKVD